MHEEDLYNTAIDLLKENSSIILHKMNDYPGNTLLFNVINKSPAYISEELNKISHRTYSQGFYFGRPENAQTYASAGYIRDYTVAGVVDGYEDGMVLLTLKNKFLKGQVFDCLSPKSEPFFITADKMFNADGQEIDSAPHPMMTVKIPYPHPIKKGSLLRMQSE